jgi:hypothetical protein
MTAHYEGIILSDISPFSYVFAASPFTNTLDVQASSFNLGAFPQSYLFAEIMECNGISIFFPFVHCSFPSIFVLPHITTESIKYQITKISEAAQ